MLDGWARTATVTAASEMTLLVGSADELLGALELAEETSFERRMVLRGVARLPATV